MHLAAFVRDVAAGTRAATRSDMRALRAAGHTRDAIFHALVGAATGRGSRSLHRALAVLRDLESEADGG